MAHLSASFSNPTPGLLTIALSGTFYQDTSRDAGFPSTSGGVANILVRAGFGVSGSYKYLECIDRYAPSVVLQTPYPGNSVVWSIFTETVARISPTGTADWQYGIKNLLLTLSLIKK